MQIPSLKKLRPSKETVKKTAYIGTWVVVIGAILFLSYFIYLASTLPDPDSIATRRVTQSTKIYDRTGNVLLYDIHGEERRTIIPWEEIPLSARLAVLAAEDDNFYNHGGIDIKGIIRAVSKDVRHLDFSEGGSTITQQLIKKALFTDEKLVSRKIREILLALEVENRFSKDEILWMYLNQIPYGSNLYGIEAASRAYFAKSAPDLTLAESAILAAMVRAPSYYSPYGTHIPELMARKDFLLNRMYELGYITEEEKTAAIAQEVTFSQVRSNILAPHFVFMVREYLVDKYGEDMVENGGLKIITTLDAELQELAEQSVTKYSNINKKRYRANNAAMVAIDPNNGDLLVLVGSSDYFDIENEGNFNVATASRQPGSSFKPFAYATLLQKGYPDSTILFDVKTEFNPNCSPTAVQVRDQYGANCYNPQNYDGTFRGPVTVRQALSQSLNIPAVKTLYLAGVQDTITLAEKMGISTLQNRERFGLALVLGGAEVKLVDMVSAYGVFANDGIRNNWSFIQSVESSSGRILEKKESSPKRALDAKTARMINNILSDNNARAPVFGYSNSLYIPGKEVAAKTGTTQENRDAWVVGYSPSLAVGVWVGNNNNQSMSAAGAGISASGPMWNEFMSKALNIKGSPRFINPDPVASSKPMLNGDYVYRRDGSSEPEIHTILHFVDRSNPLGDIPVNPAGDSQYLNWEWAIRNYYGVIAPSPSLEPTPTNTASPSPTPTTSPVTP